MMTISSANDPPPMHAADSHAPPHEASSAAAVHVHAAGGLGAGLLQLPQHCGYHVHSASAASRQLPGGGPRGSGAGQGSGTGQQQQQQLEQPSSWEAGLPKWAQLVPEVKLPSSWALLPSPVLLGAAEAEALEDLTLGLGQHCARQRPFFPGAAAAAQAAGIAVLNQFPGFTPSALPTNGDGVPAAAQPSTKATAGVETAALTPPVHLQWVSDWRLRAALSSPELWEDLLLQLRVVSAVCLSNAGRPRNAALLWADVGLLFLRLGHTHMAHRMLENLCMTAAAERWDAIMASLLPHMIQCQILLGHVMLPFTCLRYLGLPPEGASNPEFKQEVLSLLLKCAHPTDGLSPWAHAGIQLHALHALQVAPAAGCFSWFYGSGGKASPSANPNTSNRGASPQWTFLHPAPHRLGVNPPQKQGFGGGGANELHTHRSSMQGEGEATLGQGAHRQQQQQQQQQRSYATSQGARLVHAGELVPVCVDVWSNLPAPIMLTDLSLVLRTIVRAAAAQLPPPSPVSLPGTTMPASLAHPHNSRVDASPPSSAPSTWPTPPLPHHQRNHSTGHTRPPPSPLSPAASTTHAYATSAPVSSAASITDVGLLEPLSHPLHRPSHSSSVSDLSTASEPATTHSHASTHTLASRSDFGAVGSPPHSRPFLSPPHHRSSYDASALRAPAHSLPSASTTTSTGPSYSPLYAHLHLTGGHHPHPYKQPVHAALPTSDMHHAHPDSAGPHNPPLHLQQQQQQHLHKQHAAGADGKGAGSKDPKAAGNKSGWAAGPDLECRALLRVEPLGGASAGADAASAMPSHPSPAPACGTATVHGTYEQHVQEGSMARPLRAAVLHPGWNRLTFLAAPVVPGLCLVHHMSALLGTCTLRIQATPPSLRRFLHCPASPPPLPPPPTAGHSGVPGAMSAGVVDLGVDGVSREAVVLAVADVQPRMSMAAVALGGSLVAGAQQWLGVAVIPCQDTPSHLRLALLPRTKGLLRVGDHVAQPAEDLLLPVGPGGALHGGLGPWGTSAAAAANAASAAAAVQSNALLQVKCGSRAVAPHRRRLWGLHPACVWDEGARWPSANGTTADQGSTGSGSGSSSSSSSRGDGRGGSDTRRAGGAVAESCCAVLAPMATPASKEQQQQQQAEVRCRLLRGCIELSPRLLGRPCLEQPALLWLPVCVPPLLGWQTQLEAVQVEGSSAAGVMHEGGGIGSGGRQSQAEGMAEEQQQHDHHQLQQSSRPTAELDVALEYQGSDSCWRSHTSLISVPIRQPFLVSSQARALAGSTVLLTMRLQYQGTQPAVLHDAQLAPQDGCAVVSAAAPGLLPACVHPGTYLNLSFVLSTGVQYIAGSSNVQKGTVAPSSSAAAAAAADADAAVPVVNGKGVDCEGDDDEGSAAAALAMARHYGAQESKLILVYGVTTDAPHTSRPEEVPACGKQHKLCAEGSRLPLPMPPLLTQPPPCLQLQDNAPQSPPCGAENKGKGSSSVDASVSSGVHGSKLEEGGPLVFSWAFRLQGPVASGSTSGANVQQPGTVTLHFLGPLVAHVGEPTTLSWQVTRAQVGGNGEAPTPVAQHSVQSGQSGMCGVPEEETELVGYDIEQPCCPGQQQQQQQQHGKPMWHMAAGCSGVLRLGVQPGALGVVETVVAPMKGGLLPPPCITFQGLRSASTGQAQTHLIHVLPA